MLSLHVSCRALNSRVLLCQAAAAAVFKLDLTRLHFYSHSRNISTSCSTNARKDSDNFYAKSAKQTRNNMPSHGSSVFFAGSFKERGIENKEVASPSRNRVSMRMSLPAEPLGCDGWSKLQEQFNHSGNFEEEVTIQMVATDTDFKIAKSFLSFVAEKNGDISYRVLINYLVLCVQQNQSAEVCDLYDIMKMKFPGVSTFDCGAGSLFIRGLGKTDRWREAIGILEAMKTVGPVSMRNYADCVKAAVEHSESALALELYDEMIQGNLPPPEDAIQSLFDAPQQLQDDAYRKKLLAILSYFRVNQIYPTEALMKCIKSWFESIPNESWRGTLTEVSNSGHCQACKQTIESIQLTPDEYSVLKKAVIHSIIKGEDTFRKTTPQELQRFLEFVNSQPPYDIVVDGLNVAYHSHKAISSLALLNVVSYLKSRGKRVLVLGRKHMLLPNKRWRKQDIQRLQTCADCYFLDNISLDDPFLLYASINSGSHCCILTRDLLRDHKACLPDAETRQLFFKWQRGHQLVLSSFDFKNVTLQPVLSYDTVVQCTDTSYHIPYDKTNVVRASYEVPRSWLCVKKSL